VRQEVSVIFLTHGGSGGTYPVVLECSWAADLRGSLVQSP